jgi:hypothetical protein
MNAAQPSIATTARPRLAALALLTLAIFVGLSSASAFALPEGRKYEIVSPPYKAGYGVLAISAVAPGGEAVVFSAQGLFAGQPSYSAYMSYLAHRGPSGWSTTPVDAPSVLAPTSSPLDYTASLSSVLSSANLGPNAGASEAAQGNEAEFLLHSTELPDTETNWEVAGGLAFKSLDGQALTLTEQDASANLCRILVEGSSPVLEEAQGTDESIYELEDCEGKPSLKLMAVDNRGNVINARCQARGGGQYASSRSNTFNTVSASGQEVFFSDQAALRGECEGSISDPQVFVRVDGARTLEVSKPIAEEGSCAEVPCPGFATRPPVYFEGASESGSRVFLETTAPLTSSDTDNSTNLYMATIGCPVGAADCEAAAKRVTSLVQVSHDPRASEPAEVQGVVRVAPNGARVYFVARGVLSTAPNVEGRSPVSGADNLYLSEGVPGAVPVFVADLCSGPGLSGMAQDPNCPSELSGSHNSFHNDMGLWLGGTPEAQSTANGEYLVFSTWGQLLPSDTDNAKDVYRYDAATGMLARVSLGEEGAEANGNRNDEVSETPESSNPAFADATIADGELGGIDASYQQREMGTRAISEDGSRIVFSATAPLSSQATNGLPDIYEWHMEPGWSEGRVSLISSGSAPTPDREAVISPTGSDIFFETSAGLVPQDADGQLDVYDARLGGGFPAATVPVEECLGDACQGALTDPAPLLVPGSSSQLPGENLLPPAAPSKGKPMAGKTKPRSRCPRAEHRSHGKCMRTITGKKRTTTKRASQRRRVK